MRRLRRRSARVRGTCSHGSEITSVGVAASGRRLPGRVLVEPGAYRVGRDSFAIDEPGAYLFEDDGSMLEQRIVPGAWLEGFLTDLSWLWGYGSADDSLSPRARLRRALHARVSATCTPLSSDLASILCEAGFRARVVLIFTREELNDVDNGHTLLEIVSQDGWAVYDPSFRTFFTRGAHRLSLLEWCNAIQEGEYEIEPLPGGAPHLGGFGPTSAALRERMEKLVASEDERRRWYHRLAGAPLVRTADGRFSFAADDPLAAVLSAYSSTYAPLDPAEFRRLWSDAEPAA